MTDIKNKKGTDDLKRLLIYLALSFALTWIWFALAIPKGEYWDDMSQQLQSFVALGMMFPVISHVLTRLITKEGFRMTGSDSMMLGISFKDSRWVCLMLAVFLPWILGEAACGIALLISPECYDPGYYLTLGIDRNTLMIYPIAAIVSGLIGSFAAFGEEGGWRGYMMPKLMKLMPKWAAFIVGGIIWGLWHAPLTWIGHNFGTDYPGFPYLGIVRMCIMCILLGILLTYVTQRSGSVWPAAVMHAVYNTNPAILNGFIDPDKVSYVSGRSSYWIGSIVVLAVAAVVVLIIWRKTSYEVQ